MYAQIGRHIQDIKTYHNFIASSKTVHTQCKPFTKKKTREITNHLWKLVKKFPETNNFRWDWGKISANPCITTKIISKHPELPWASAELKNNPNITWDFFINYIKNAESRRQDKHSALVGNISIYPCYSTMYPCYSMAWEIVYISRAKNTTLETVKNNLTFPWDLLSMSENPNITWRMIKDFNIPDTFHPMKYIIDQFNKTDPNKDISLGIYREKDSEKDPDKLLKSKKNISLEKILSRDGKNTDWRKLSKNKKLTYKFVMENVDKPFDWYLISSNTFGK
jgi:hypothetical protein